MFPIITYATCHGIIIKYTALFSVFEAIFGMLLFGESLALLWWLGASLIILGLLLLNYASQQSERATDESDKKQQ
jgi:drug/metabolite transporter (DMT)-like permease